MWNFDAPLPRGSDIQLPLPPLSIDDSGRPPARRVAGVNGRKSKARGGWWTGGGLAREGTRQLAALSPVRRRRRRRRPVVGAGWWCEPRIQCPWNFLRARDDVARGRRHVLALLCVSAGLQAEAEAEARRRMHARPSSGPDVKCSFITHGKIDMDENGGGARCWRATATARWVINS